MSAAPVMTQAFDMSTELFAIEATPLVPLSSQPESTSVWDDDDFSCFVEMEDFPLLQSIGTSNYLASGHPSPEPGSTGFSTEAEPAATSDHLVVAGIRDSARLPDPEAMSSTPFDEPQTMEVAKAADPSHSVCETMRAASGLLLLGHAQPSECPVVQIPIYHQTSASSREQRVDSAQLLGEGASNETYKETDSDQSEQSLHQEPEVCSPISPKLGSKDPTGLVEDVILEKATPSSPVGLCAKDRDSTSDNTILEKDTPASPIDLCAGDRNSTSGNTILEKDTPASPVDLCARDRNSASGNKVTRGTHDVDPVPDQESTTPNSDHHEAGRESPVVSHSDGLNSAAPSAVLSSNVLVDLGARSSNGRVSQEAEAMTSEGSCDCSEPDVARSLYTERKRRKQSAFKSPLPLMESTFSALPSHSKRKRSVTSSEGLTVADPICVDDSDGDESLRLTRPSNNGNLTRPRPKRQRGHPPNYIQYTDLEVFSRFEALGKEWSQAACQLQTYRDAHQSFLEYIQGLGYDG